jgi:hypothetical protein
MCVFKNVIENKNYLIITKLAFDSRQFFYNNISQTFFFHSPRLKYFYIIIYIDGVYILYFYISQFITVFDPSS